MFWLAPKWLIAPAVVGLVGTAMVFNPESDAAIDRSTRALTATDTDHQRMMARGKAVLDRIEYKDELIDQLIAGRLSLAEVASEFLRMNEDTPVLNRIRNTYPGATDEEKSARNVLDFIRARKLPASQNARVFGRLQSQLEQISGHQHQSSDRPPYARPVEARAQRTD